jgi:hypothetical protein
MNFEGRWRDSFGTPSPSGVWMIYGTSGSGKTSFALQLAKYLTRFGKVIYWSLEQGNTLAFQMAWNREGIPDCGNDVILADEDERLGPDNGIEGAMNARRGRNILIIDSITVLRTRGFNIFQYDSLVKRLRGKLIVFISHEQYRMPDSKVGNYILKLADLKMNVVGFKVFTNTRSGKRMDDFVINEGKMNEYWTDKI